MKRKKVNKKITKKATKAKANPKQDWTLVNLKVKNDVLLKLDAKAKKFANGNRSRLLLESAMERKTALVADFF